MGRRTKPHLLLLQPLWRGKEMKGQQLEAEKGGGGGGGGDSGVPIWDCGSPLYDSFEVASLCHLLDRHLMQLPFSKGSGRLTVRPADEPDESKGKKMVVVSAGRWRGKKEMAKKKSKVGLKGIYRAIALWRKQS